MPGKKSKNRFKFFTARSSGNPTNTAVDPLGPRMALNIDPKVEGNHPRHELGGGRPDLTTILSDDSPKPPGIASRDSEQEPSVPGPSTAVAGLNFEQNDHTASGTIGHISQEGEPEMKHKVLVLEQDHRYGTSEATNNRTDVEKASESGFGPLRSLLGSISTAYANHKEPSAIKNKAEGLILRVASLDEFFGTPPSDVAEQRRRPAVIKELKEIEDKLWRLSGEPRMEWLIDHTQHDEDVSRLLEDLRETIFHYQMARQSQINDRELLSIRNNLSLQDSGDAATIEKLCRAQEAEFRHAKRDRCLKGTRITVLDEIELWARDVYRPPVYWLNGLAGMGKSTIAQTIAERMFSDGNLGASSFCSNLKFIFPTIAAQLCRRYPEFRSILIPMVRSNPGVIHENLDSQMNRLLVQPLVKSGVSTVVVIDVLDECQDNEPASAILSVLGPFMEQIPKVKFLVTGRPEPRIRNAFRLSLLTKATDVFVLHKVEPGQVNSDIRLFYKLKCSEIRSRRPGLDGWPTEEQLHLLTERAAGLFIYAMATVRFIDHNIKNPRRQLDLLIQSQESASEGRTKLRGDTTLDSLYMAIFHNAFSDNDPEDDTRVRSVLGAVFFATNPLSPATIAVLLGLDPGDMFHLLSSLHSLLILSDNIDHPVQPFHKSFYDFIIDPNRCDNPRFWLSPPDQHAELVVKCLELMNQKLGQEQSAERLAKMTLDYACNSWLKHLSNITSTQKAKILPAMHLFFGGNLWFWLERYWLIPERLNSIAAINKWLGMPQTPHLSHSPGALPLKPLQMASCNSSLTRARNSNASDKAEINHLDQVLEQGSVGGEEQARLLDKLWRLCKDFQDVPESVNMLDCNNVSETLPMHVGQTAVVFKGIYQGRSVAVKLLHGFCKEAVIWRHLHHPNIVPLIGVAISPGQCLLVSDWVDDGTIDQFIKMNPDVNRIDLLIDVVEGLMYMHNLSIVHGGLCMEKILITQSGHACLIGFGNATTAGSLQDLSFEDVTGVSGLCGQGSQLWMAVRHSELKATGLTKELDVCALGLVIYEVLCGFTPPHESQECLRFLRKRREKPEDAAGLGFTGGLWEILEQCWLFDPEKRPTLGEVLACMREIAPSWDSRQAIV
ncbi:hypothetical protein BJ322DRAFT_1176897 [Thelephora terrestris]|uniref:Protein kinase domain-containing protein n=1 Tax=Thelephora terrestris TaxID=56493 RepID=A0A9P6L9W8_9AGAM|nr:hypothetical protein BJ322DRAFT_1176897 [Thelephora terrestris]